MKTATPAQQGTTVQTHRIPALAVAPIASEITDGSLVMINEWDSASVKRLKKLIAALRTLAKSSNELANEMKGSS